MSISTKRSRIRTFAVAVSILTLGTLSAGCELAVDFNRALIEGGTDAAFFDAGDAGTSAVDAGVDALPVPDAVADVVFSDASPVNADARADAATDATVKDAATSDATGDAGTKG